jgi:hypothetical protein
MATLTQCRLRSPKGENVVSWIPTKAAKLGTTMTLEDLEGRYEVIFVGDTLDEETVREQGSYHRTHRKGTDI